MFDNVDILQILAYMNFPISSNKITGITDANWGPQQDQSLLKTTDLYVRDIFFLKHIIQDLNLHNHLFDIKTKIYNDNMAFVHNLTFATVRDQKIQQISYPKKIKISNILQRFGTSSFQNLSQINHSKRVVTTINNVTVIIGVFYSPYISLITITLIITATT